MQSLYLVDPAKTEQLIVQFIRQTYQQAHKNLGLVAVSGGLDSAVSLSLLTRALGAEQVLPVFLPVGEQSNVDSEEIANWNQIPQKNWQTVEIQPLVDQAVASLSLSSLTDQSVGKLDKVRIGNIMARLRMIALFDLAKKHDGLVCGTENKSEKYLGYFTRFGDEASDLEPLQQLYKTQVRQLAEWLKLPAQFITKAPTAGLWPGQTDQAELGFSYEQADQVMLALEERGWLKEGVETIDEGELLRLTTQLTLTGIDEEVVQKIFSRIKSQAFKLQVPYHS